MDPRPDLLPWLDRLDEVPAIRRAERWRIRGRSGSEVAAEARCVAARLGAAGVEPGARVALHLGDGPLWHAAFFGALRAGAVPVPLDASLDPDLLRRRVGELGIVAWCDEREVPDLGLDLPRVRLGWRERVEPGPLPPLPDADPSRTAEVVLTSGTTGTPDAVPVTHANLLTVVDALDGAIDPYRAALKLLPPMRLAVALPLSHLYGQVMGAFVPVLLGARTTLVAPMPAPDLARALRRDKAWALATVPRTLAHLADWLRARGEQRWGERGFADRLEAAGDRPWWGRRLALRALREPIGRRVIAVVSGGAVLDPEVERFWRRLGIAVVQGYGLTETAPLVTLTHPLHPAEGSLGKPLPGVEVRLAGDGEILVRGGNVAPARPGGPAVDEAGWLHTGDLGRLDEEGRLRYAGRKGERIVTPAGTNVDPAPVAAALRDREGIVDAVVLERPWGEPGVVSAVLLVHPGTAPAAAVRAANETLPDPSRVRDWRLWPEADFPRTRTGKPRLGRIREWLEAAAPEAEAGEEGVEPASAPDGPTAVAREMARIGGVDPGRIEPATPIGDVLGSLDRIELAIRLESAWGIALPERAFAPDRTVEELAAALAGVASGGTPRGTAAAARTTAPSVAAGEPGPDGGGRPEPGPPRPSGPPGARSAERRIPPARWRSALPTRAGRFVLMEAIVRPLWRSLFDLDQAGAERVAALEPPFIVAANHTSELDPGPVLYGLPRSARRRLATTAMWEYFEAARTGPLLYAIAVLGLDLVPLVQRGDWRPTLEIAGRVVDRGGCPVVFPEGERTLDGELLEFRRGVGVMAAELHLPIVPCAIAGLLAVLPKGAHWPRSCWRSRARVAVRYGEPMDPPAPGDDPEETVARLKERVAALHAEARAAAGRD